MRRVFSSIWFWLAAFSLLCSFTTNESKAKALPIDQAARLLPDRVGNFRAAGPVRAEEDLAHYDFKEISAARRDYNSPKGERLFVTLVKTSSDSSAYSLLTSVLRSPEGPGPEAAKIGDVGTASYVCPDWVLFFKGSVFVHVERVHGQESYSGAMVDFARRLSETLDSGGGAIPVLVEHLPDWEKLHRQMFYAVSLDILKQNALLQPALDAIDFEGGTEAVGANYGSSQLIIVEFTTPQLAGDNDWNIRAKIQELHAQGQPVPTAYRRVGNYSVFVFNAPDEQTANQLIDQVKYEQVVQWLGDNPHWLEEAQRRYTETTLGVFVSVVKASGLAALLCFGIGGFLGALLFARRRARQTTTEAYSDAGGMMRLNLDEMTAQTDANRLIGPAMSDKL